jgi:hypothetical protein
LSKGVSGVLVNHVSVCSRADRNKSASDSESAHPASSLSPHERQRTESKDEQRSGRGLGENRPGAGFEGAARGIPTNTCRRYVPVREIWEVKEAIDSREERLPRDSGSGRRQFDAPLNDVATCVRVNGEGSRGRCGDCLYTIAKFVREGSNRDSRQGCEGAASVKDPDTKSLVVYGATT